MTGSRPEPSSVRIFDRRTALWLAGVGGVSLALAFGFGLFSEAPQEGGSAGANSFSPSAIGHAALIEFLERSGVSVQVSRYRSEEKVGPRAPLLLLEPPLDEEGMEATNQMVADAFDRDASVVLLLPRWRGEPMALRPDWLASAEPVPGEDVEALLSSVLEEEFGGSLLRGKAPEAWSSVLDASPAAELPAPQLPAPQLIRPRESTLTPLIWSAEGILAAEAFDGWLLVISDPDLWNTRGLGLGDNAALAHRLLVEHLGAETLVVDETLHGFVRPPSIWRELLEPPLLTVTLHFLLLLAFLLWAALVRFGRPLRAPGRVEAGSRALIENTVRLLSLGGHHAYAARRFLRLVVRRMAARCGLPLEGDDRRMIPRLARLARLGRARGVREDLEDVARQILRLQGRRGEAARALTLCNRLDRWRKEFTNGA